MIRWIILARRKQDRHHRKSQWCRKRVLGWPEVQDAGIDRSLGVRIQ